MERLDELCTELWSQLRLARERNDWQSYWKLRRSWLAVGRLHSLLIQQQAEERSAQLSLLPSAAGRIHDADVSG